MKKITFAKYHALGNDFLVLESSRNRLTKRSMPALAKKLCDRRTGVGADGIVWLSSSRKADFKFDIYNADGSWAEKSGNGLRIAAVHLARQKKRKKFTFETTNSIDEVVLQRKTKNGYIAKAEIGRPEFLAKKVPVKTRLKYIINSPLKFGTVNLPVTCLAVGNPHTILLVDDFDFDWPTLGEEIEHARHFPLRTNVEFVKLINRKKVRVCEWERGAGMTGSSGTGAAAVVCAMVMMGLAERHCEVVFESGSLKVYWDEKTDIVEITGPVERVFEGTCDF